MFFFNNDLDLESNIEIFEKVIIEIVNEILGNKIIKKKVWVIFEVLSLCDKRRDFKEKKKSCF